MNPISLGIATLAALLPITNPLGAMAAFSGLTSSFDSATARRQAIRTGIYVGAILAVFALLGSLILKAFGISLSALQIAGGLVVMHSGFGMLTARASTTAQEDEHAHTKQDISFSPMALPLVAGPGAIGVVIALASRHQGVGSHVAIAVAGLLIGVLIAVLLVYGAPLVNKLGPTGVGALTRIMGFLILAIGVELLVHGVLASLPAH